MFSLYIFLCLLLTFIYFFAIKPYLQILKLKKVFQEKGYKVLVQPPLNFIKENIFGSIKQDLKNHKDALWRLKNTYTDYDVILKNSMNKVFINFNNISLLQDIFQKIQSFQKPTAVLNNFQRLYGGGLAMSQGTKWKAKRKLYSQIFNFKLLQQLHEGIVQTVDKSLNKFETNKQLNMMHQLRTLFFNMFVISYFGKPFDQFSYKGMNYSQSIVELVNQIYKQCYTWGSLLLGSKFLEKGFTKTDQQIEFLLKAVLNQTQQFIEKRYHQMKNSKSSQGNILSKVVFNSHFSQLSQSQKSEMFKQVTGDVLTFFLGNTDTGSSALGTTLHILAKNPEILQKLRKQQQLFNKDYSFSQIKNLKYMDAVFNQTLRLYGPANWLFIRQVKNEVTQVGGISIPKGTLIGIQTQTIHCSDKFYQNPFEFNPQRWLSGKKQEPYSFISFSAGQRNCIGQHLARTEFKIALSKIINKFQFSTTDEFVMGVPFVYAPIHNQFILKQRK